MALIEVLKYDGGDIVRKIPESGAADIKIGAQLLVHETQSAIFYRDRKALDVFGPGKHTLTTSNVPILMDIIKKHLTDGDTPFAAEVVFVNQKVYTGLKWGTSDPIDLMDPQMNIMVPLRAFGEFSVRVEDPRLFVNDLVGVETLYTMEQLNNFLKAGIVTHLSDLLSETFKGYFEIRKYFEEYNGAMKIRTKEDFQKYGIEVRDFFIKSITVDEDTHKMLKERSRATLLGSDDKFMRLKTADAIGDMAKSSGGGGGAMQMGAGLGMGIMMPQIMAQTMGGVAPGQQPATAQQAPAQQATAVATIPCPACNTPVPQGAKFCANCGGKIGTAKCPKCQADVPMGAKFCMSCGNPMEALKCPKCQADLQPGSKFCMSCGEKLE